jgi:hypothetical protein
MGVLCLIVAFSPALGSTTSLNTIPTTDLVPLGSWIAQVQNGNVSLSTLSLITRPEPSFQTEYSLGSRMEWGVDYIQPPDVGHMELTLNIKGLLQSEDELRPNVAIGIWNIALHQRPGLFLTFSKTLNYAEEMRERFRAHHRRNRKLLGRRIHAGLTLDGYGTLEPFLGTDLQINESTVFQADWINGSGNALTFGIAYVCPDQRTVLNPAFLYSNSTHQVDGFLLSISHQFNL